MKQQLLKKMLSYQNKWVALNASRSEILATGTTVEDVERKLNKQKKQAAIITKVLPKNKLYVANSNKNL